MSILMLRLENKINDRFNFRYLHLKRGYLFLYTRTRLPLRNFTRYFRLAQSFYFPRFDCYTSVSSRTRVAKLASRRTRVYTPRLERRKNTLSHNSTSLILFKRDKKFTSYNLMDSRWVFARLIIADRPIARVAARANAFM